MASPGKLLLNLALTTPDFPWVPMTFPQMVLYLVLFLSFWALRTRTTFFPKYHLAPVKSEQPSMWTRAWLGVWFNLDLLYPENTAVWYNLYANTRYLFSSRIPYHSANNPQQPSNGWFWNLIVKTKGKGYLLGWLFMSSSSE